MWVLGFTKLVLLLFFVCIWLVCMGTDVIHVNVHHRSLGPEGNPLIYLHSSPFEQTKQKNPPRANVPHNTTSSRPFVCSSSLFSHNKNIAKLRDANEEKNKQKQITVRHVQTAKNKVQTRELGALNGGTWWSVSKEADIFSRDTDSHSFLLLFVSVRCDVTPSHRLLLLCSRVLKSI